MESVKKSRQFLAAILVNLSALGVGTSLGWTSPVLPKLFDKNQTPLNDVITKNSSEEAWITSTYPLGAILGSLIAGPITGKIGRKWAAHLNGIILASSYIVLLFANEVWVIYLGRVIQGIGNAFMMTSVPIYVGEISSTELRGTTGSIVQISLIGGVLYSYAVGPFVSYAIFQWACIGILVIFELTFFFMPESPYYYIEKNNKSEAVKSLMFLRGQSSKGVESELAEIEASEEESMRDKVGFMDIVKIKGNRRALIICSGLFMFQQLCGINVVLFNSQNIFKSATESIPSEIAALIVPSAQLLFCTVASAIADRMGRRPILISSAATMCIASVGLGVCFYLKDSNVDMSQLGWLPVVCLVTFVLGYTGGFGFLPFVAFGEMFPANIKSRATSISSVICWIFGFLITQYYSALNNLGSYYPFFLYGIFNIAAIVFVLFVLIETKGLNFQEIQNKLNKL